MRTKSFLFSMLAVAGMLFVSSCAQDDALEGAADSKYVDATFTVTADEVAGTRATIGDGTTVNYVACAIYDEKTGEEIEGLRQYKAITNKAATYSVRLVKGQGYRAVFFAYCGQDNGVNAYYDLSDLKNIEVEAAMSNLEERDAFTGYVDVKAEETLNSVTKPVKLTRPFAQLNLGISEAEYEAAKTAEVIVTKSKVTVSNVYSNFSAYDNAIPETATAASVTFDLNTIPSQDLIVVDGDDTTSDEYHYLALNYLLVGNEGSEKKLTDVTFVWETAEGKTNSPATTFINIPVQRNYRTNIVGNLLTAPADFNVSIDQQFESEKNAANKDYIHKVEDQNGNVVNKYLVSTAKGLQEAIDAATGNTIINFTQNIDVTTRATAHLETMIAQKVGLNLIIDGCGFKYDGAFKVHSNSNRNNNGPVTFKNINFETATESVNAFIQALDFGDGIRYSQNLTVDNCTFTAVANSEAVKAVVGIKINSSQNFNARNCTARDLHSFIQAQSCDDSVTLDNITIENCKNGVSFGNTATPTLTNSTISVDAYGVRGDADASRGNLVIKNTTINANHPVTIRKVTTDGYSVALENVTLNAGQLYGVIFTKNGEETVLEAPTGTFSITGAEKYNVYTGAAATVLKANNDAQLAQALGTEVQTIELAAGEYVANLYEDGKTPSRETLNIVGTEGTKLAFANLQVRASKFDEVYISNCEILRMPNKSWGHLVFGGSGKANGVYTLENCVFNGVGTQGIYINETASGATYNILNCTFNGDFGREGAIVVQTNKDVNHNVNVQGCTFNNIPETSHRYYLAPWDGKTGFYYGWNFNTDLIATTAYEIATLANLGFTNIDLADGEYDVYGCAGKTLTLNGSKNAVIIVKNEGEDGCDYAFGGPAGVGNITFNGLTINTTQNTGNYKGFAYMKGTFNDCNFVGPYSLNNANDFVFKGCTFDFKNGYFWTWGANSVKFDECTFNGNSKTILAHGYASTVITINNCNFAATEKGYTGSGDHTAAVEIDPAGTNTYTINFTGNNTLSDNYAGWTRVKDNSTGHTITGVN